MTDKTMTRDELPRVSDFLMAQRQDEEAFSRLVDAMVSYAESIDDDIDIPTDHDQCAEILAHVIDELAEKPTAPSDYVVVPQVMAEEDIEPDRVTIHCVASLYLTEDLPKARAYRDVRPVLTIAEVHETTDALPLIVPWGFEFSPWSEIANHRTFVPEGLSRKQVAQFAADLIWEITLCGLTEERARVRAEEIIGSIEESSRELDEAIARDDLESVTSPFDPRAALVELVGEVEVEFSDAMLEVTMPISHNLWLSHMALLADIADHLDL